jgi:glycopeptide antibiotics resistance protein
MQKKKGIPSNMKNLMRCLFFLYCVLLAEILFFGRKADLSISVTQYFFLHANYRPFATVLRYVLFFLHCRDIESFCLALVNLGGNFMLFFPFGFLFPVLFPSFRRYLLLILAVVLLTEMLQGFLRIGVPDIDDLIFNVTGAWIGILWGKKFCRSAVS